MFIPLTVTFLLSLLLLLASYYISLTTSQDTSKLSPYECGFDPYSDSRHKGMARFYLVGILYLLFDLELSYLLPIVTVWDYIYLDSFKLYVLVIILIVGVIYEYKLQVVLNSQLI